MEIIIAAIALPLAKELFKKVITNTGKGAQSLYEKVTEPKDK